MSWVHTDQSRIRMQPRYAGAPTQICKRWYAGSCPFTLSFKIAEGWVPYCPPIKWQETDLKACSAYFKARRTSVQTFTDVLITSATKSSGLNTKKYRGRSLFVYSYTMYSQNATVEGGLFVFPIGNAFKQHKIVFLWLQNLWYYFSLNVTRWGHPFATCFLYSNSGS